MPKVIINGAPGRPRKVGALEWVLRARERGDDDRLAWYAVLGRESDVSTDHLPHCLGFVAGHGWRTVTDVQRTFSVVTHSGYVVAFDPAVVVLRGEEPPDLETLEAGNADGSILWSAALDDETLVRVLVDEPLPESLASVADPEAEMELRVPSGHLWIADPAYLHTRERPAPVPEAAGRQLDVTPGDYRATAYLLEPRPSDIDTQLRRAAGTLPVAVRDGLGIGTFFLAVLTVIGLPVYLIGRVLEDGLTGVFDGLGLGLAVLAPLWLVVLVAWRLPVLRRVDRADEEIARQYPDLVIALTHHSRGREPSRSLRNPRSA